MVKVAGPKDWVLLIMVGFNSISGQIKTDFQVLEFAVDGYKTNPISFATLEDHNPGTPFPDIFTICWRCWVTFARDLFSNNIVEIPHHPGQLFLKFYSVENGTDSLFYGED